MRWLSSLRLGGLMVMVGSCAAAHRDVRSVSDILPSRWHYDVSMDAALTQMDVKVCFEGAVARELRAGTDEAASQLSYARTVSPGAAQGLPVTEGRIQIAGNLRNACIAYGVRLREHDGLGSMVRRVGHDVLVSSNVWLWRPQRRAADARATLRFHLPEGTRVSVPWRERANDGVRVLSSDAFRFDAYTGFGRFHPFTVTHSAVTLDVTVFDGTFALDKAALTRWLKRTIEIASGVEGKFPVPDGQVLIVPSGSAVDPVQLGMVARGGAGSILLFVSSNAEESALLRDWVLPHELSHLLVPYVRRDQAWLSEGLATYYQEVLLARSGTVTEQDTLHGIADALASARAEGTGRRLVDESAAMHETFAFRAVYWAGAAYFLLADVELRRRSRGRTSLDSVLTALKRRTELDAKTWTADDLLRELDVLAGTDVFVPLAKKVLALPFPEYEETLKALGLRAQGAALDETAPLAGIRRAIFRPRCPFHASTNGAKSFAILDHFKARARAIERNRSPWCVRP